MTETRKRLAFCFCSVSLVILSGCAGNHSHQRFAIALMPPAPAQAVSSPVADTPQVVPTVTVSESPKFLNSRPQLPPKPTLVDIRLRHVDERYSAGKKAYQNGDISAARREFDK